MPVALSEEQSTKRPESLKKYTRLKHTPDERQYLRIKGFVPVVSSNVSAVARDQTKLIVRFHGGATYVYPSSGDKFDDMLNSGSKGRFVWQQLVKPRVPYYKTNNYNIPDDVEDRDMMRPMAETDVEIDTLVSEQARATVVKTTQAQGIETIVDIRTIPKPDIPAGLGVSDDEVLSAGIIASVALANMINNAEEAEEENSRQA